MLSDRMKKLIFPYLRMEIPEACWKDIEYMLNEAYYYKKDGRELIALRPALHTSADYISLLFNPLNGACVDIEGYEFVKQNGKPI